jgi:subfamily B ATP-binding cassette protein MsbA
MASPKEYKSFLGIYWRLLGAVRPYAWQLVGAIVCMIVLAVTTGIYAYVVGPMLKFLVSKGEAGGQDILSLVPGLDVAGMDENMLLMALPVFILVVALVKGVSYFGQFFLMGMVGQKVVADLRQSMFQKLTEMSMSFYLSVPTGQIISRFTSDVLAVEQAVTYSVASYLRDSMQVIVLTILAFILDWELAFIAFVIMPVAVFPIVYFGKRLKNVSTDSQVSLGAIADRLHEAIKGMRIVQLFGAEAFEKERFRKENRSYLRIMLRSFAVRALQSPVMEFLGAAGLAGTIWYAGSRMSEGSLDPGNFVSFFAAVMMLYNPIKSLGRIGGVTAAGVAAAERVFALLDEPQEVIERPNAYKLDGFKQEITFDKVCFSYGQDEVLKDVAFSAACGEVLAVVGPSGAGKTTLVNLIPRFFDVEQGSIKIDDHDIRDLTLTSLRANIGVVSQDVVLFNDTVKNNIAYGLKEISDQQLIEVARKANALDFIEGFEDGFDTPIGEGGVRLSGGQRQRLAIARALMRDAPILILDEATSALDSESEQAVQQALAALMENRTAIVIAHRLSTIMRSDRILVIDDGQIVEQGNHQELLEQDGLYRRLYDLQFKDN